MENITDKERASTRQTSFTRPHFGVHPYSASEELTIMRVALKDYRKVYYLPKILQSVEVLKLLEGSCPMVFCTYFITKFNLHRVEQARMFILHKESPKVNTAYWYFGDDIYSRMVLLAKVVDKLEREVNPITYKLSIFNSFMRSLDKAIKLIKTKM